MHRAGNFHTSRYLRDETPTQQFAVFFLRLAPLGTRFVSGVSGLLPHPRALQQARRYSLATSAVTRAEALNAQDRAARAG